MWRCSTTSGTTGSRSPPAPRSSQRRSGSSSWGSSNNPPSPKAPPAEHISYHIANSATASWDWSLLPAVGVEVCLLLLLGLSYRRFDLWFGRSRQVVHPRAAVGGRPLSALRHPDHIPSRNHLRFRWVPPDSGSAAASTRMRRGVNCRPDRCCSCRVPADRGASSTPERRCRPQRIGRSFWPTCRGTRCCRLSQPLWPLPATIPASPVMMGLSRALAWANRTAIPFHWSPPSGTDP